MINIFFYLTDEKMLPEFPLIPASKGFCITLRKTLATFREVLIEENIIQKPSNWQDSKNVKQLMNNTAVQCQETSKAADKATVCDRNSSNTQESNKQPISNGSSRSVNKGATTSSSSTNSSAAALSETKTSTSSQNTS